MATRLAGASAFIRFGMQSAASVAVPVVASISRLFIFFRPPQGLCYSDRIDCACRCSYPDHHLPNARRSPALKSYRRRVGLEILGPLELRKAHKYEFIWRMNDMLAFAT